LGGLEGIHQKIKLKEGKHNFEKGGVTNKI